MLHQRVEDPQHHRDRAYRQHEAAPRERRHAQAGHAHAEDSVDPGLDQDPRHQRGDRAGRRGVGLGEPDVEGDHPGLEAEPGEEQEEDAVARDEGRRARPQSLGERQRAPVRSQQEEAGDQAARGHVGHGQVQEGGAARLRVLVLGRYQGGGGERHELPRQQESDRLTRHEDHLERAQQHVVGDAHEGVAAGARVGEVADAVDGDGNADDRQHHQEEARQRVQRVVEGQPRGFVAGQAAAEGGPCAEGEETDSTCHQGGRDGSAERRETAQPRSAARDERGQRWRSAGSRRPAAARRPRQRRPSGPSSAPTMAFQIAVNVTAASARTNGDRSRSAAARWGIADVATGPSRPSE